MASGDVHIYDIQNRSLTNYVIECGGSQRPGLYQPLRVIDMKCQPEKMHRLLVAQKSQACVYSLNKRTVI